MLRRALLSAVIALAACGGSPRPLPPPPTTPPAPTAVTPPPSGSPVATLGADDAPLPLWSQVKKGTLANGLTYYILPAHKPEKRAFLWLAVNAGSNLEDQDQRGLAHFDEHMAFNGTKHFPQAALIDYLQSIGMRFGADLNAYTSWDETVYQLEVPTDKPEFLGKGLDILRDWAGNVTYDPKEVEKERGVVREEWRLGRGANQRMFDKESKVLFKGSRYAEHLPIGEIDIIDHAPRDTLYRFYKDWYRPDLMAVIVVGEIEPAAIQKEIEARFGDLKNPAPERPRTKAEVPKADGTRVSIVTDHEATSTQVSVYNLVPTRSRASRKDDRRMVVEQIYQALLAERFAALRRKPDAPFIAASAGAEPIVREIGAFARNAQVKTGKTEEALRALLIEVARVERHGFTATELERARTNLARAYEEMEASEATHNSRSYAQEITRNFFEHELMVGSVAERKLAQEFLPTITLAELNQLATSYGGADNRVITVSAPDGTPLPTQARVLEIVDEVAKSDVPAWEDKPVATQLLAAAPAPGKIVKEKVIASLGVTEWTLSNGARVIVKPSDFEADAVSFEASSPGGAATAKDADYGSIRWADQLVALGGVGAFDSEQLAKVLAGKQVSVQTAIGEATEGLAGTASAKDLETMFQLVYLRMTAPRKDQAQVDIWKQTVAEQLTNLKNDPSFAFQRDAVDVLYKHNVRKTLPTVEDIGKVDLDKAFAFYQDRFGDASDFTFVIVGSVDLARVRPLVETYLASLPAKGRKEKEKDVGIRKVGGVVKKTWTAGQAPRASVRLDFHADETWTRDKDRDVYILGQVLSNRLREDLREDKSGVYGVGANGFIARSPHQERTFSVQFGCDPKRVDELVTAVLDDVAKVAKDGVKDDELEKVRQTFTRQRETELRTNRFWTGWLDTAARYGDDPTIVLDLTGMLGRVTSKNVQASAKHYLDTKAYFEAVLLPADAAAAPAK